MKNNFMAVSTIVSAAIVCILPIAVLGSGWNYDTTSPEGPSHWAEHYPTCGGTNQSPINIVTTGAVTQSALNSLTFVNYDKAPSKFTMDNNGHSVQITIPAGQDISVAGGGLNEKYILEQFHFHWGTDDTQGSEHLVDGKQHPLEIHLVHYSSKYTSVSAASADTSNPSGVAVIAVFVDVAANSALLNSELGQLTVEFPKVPYEGNETEVSAFAVSSLIPKYSPYYRYNGSLTTPACAEVVVWTVFKNPIYITDAQMAEFRHFHTEGDAELLHNFRPAQPLSTRTVYNSA